MGRIDLEMTLYLMLEPNPLAYVVVSKLLNTKNITH